MKSVTQGHIKSAVRSIRTNKMRSMLTMLGIIVGVVSVVSIVSIGEGVKHQIRSQIDHMGKDLITVRPGAPSKNNGSIAGVGSLSTITNVGTLSDRDVQTVARTTHVAQSAPLAVVGGQITGADHDAGGATIIATNDSLPAALRAKIAFGANLDSSVKQATTAILGARAAERMFDDGVPLGRSFTIRGEEFNVAGIYDDFETSAFSSDIDFNNAIFIPYDTAQRITDNSAKPYEILVRPAEHTNTDAVIRSLDHNLAATRGGQHDFSVLTHAQSAAATNGILNLMTALIGGVAAISLLVGGIGIMNIMLVSVTERMHEIGIRKAVGATDRQILTQFMLEAAVLSLSGGILGVIISFLLDIMLRLGTTLQPIITWQVVVMALLVSLLVGIIFGSMPALKAARKDPIEALRKEW
ncbi:MAG: ABC transporter permease [Candidatus Saccharimonadales bacterium]